MIGISATFYVLYMLSLFFLFNHNLNQRQKKQATLCSEMLKILYTCQSLFEVKEVKVVFIQKNILFGDHSERGSSAENKEVNNSILLHSGQNPA